MSNRVAYTFVAINKFTAPARRIVSSSNKIGRSLGRVGVAAKKASRKLGLVAASVGAVVGAAKIFTGIAFDDAMSDLASISATSAENLAKLREQALLLARDTNTGATEVVGLFQQVASANAELLAKPSAFAELSRQILLLKNTAGIPLNDAATLLIDSLDTFGAGTERAAEFVNILAASASVGKSELKDTTEAINRSAVAAGQAKLNYAELNAVIQVLAKGGLKGARAGTLLSTVLLRLETGKIDAVRPSIVGIANAFELMHEKGIGAIAQNVLFGQEAIKAGGILVQNAPLIAEWTKAVIGTSEAERQAEIRLSRFSAKLKGVGIRINEAFIRTFLRLEPVMTKQITRLTDFLDALKPEQIDAFAAFLSDLVVIVSDLTAALGQLARFIRPIASGLIFLVSPIVRSIGSKIGGAASIAGGVSDFFSGLGGPATPAFAPGAAGPAGLDVNINVNQEGRVESVQTKGKGVKASLNRGENMRGQ